MKTLKKTWVGSYAVKDEKIFENIDQTINDILLIVGEQDNIYCWTGISSTVYIESEDSSKPIDKNIIKIIDELLYDVKRNQDNK